MHVNPLRCMRGQGTTGMVNSLPAVALFNNSGGSHYLKVLAWNFQASTNTILVPFVQSSRLSQTGLGNVTPVVTGISPPPGVIDWDDLASLPPADWVTDYVGLTGVGLPGLNVPYAVLAPGWSLVIALSANQTPVVGFFWEAVPAEDVFFQPSGDARGRD